MSLRSHTDPVHRYLLKHAVVRFCIFAPLLHDGVVIVPGETVDNLFQTYSVLGQKILSLPHVI